MWYSDHPADILTRALVRLSTQTFFSTAFFDFHAGEGGNSPVVSRWLWVYFVVTVLLSALVLLVYLGSRRRLGIGPYIGKGPYRA